MTMKPNDRGLSPEDRRLEAVLRAARPLPDTKREAELLERIMKAAERTPRVVATGMAGEANSVVPLDSITPSAHPTAVQKNVMKLPMHRGHQRSRRDFWAAGSVLAASLVAGLLLGQLPFAEPAVLRIEQATGINLASPSFEVARALATAAEGEEEDL